MSRLALDSVSYAALASTRWPHLIGYANGSISRWTDAQIGQTRQRGQLLALVDVLGTEPQRASILDFERGDVQSPAVVRAWAVARNQFAGDATVYCSPNSIKAVVGGLRGERCNLFVVDLTADAEPPFTVPHYPGLPANVRVIARQFVFGPRSGGDYDMSVVYADDWHPEQAAPAHLFAARAAAAAELGPYLNASSSAEIIDPRTGMIDPGRAPQLEAPERPQVGEHPFQVMTLPEPFGATLPCDWCPGPAACAGAGRCLEPDGGEAAAAVVNTPETPDPVSSPNLPGAALVASTAPDSVDVAAEHRAAEQAATARQLGQAAADVAGAAVVASTAPDSVVPADEHRAAEQAATARQLGMPGPPISVGVAEFSAFVAQHSASSGPDDGGAAAAGDSTAAAAAAQSPLNHDFIRQTLNDLEEVVTMFRAAGHGGVARELERALYLAWELGSALKSGGR